MPKLLELWPAKDYQEVNGQTTISIQMLLDIHSIYPFPDSDLDIAFFHYVMGKNQSWISEVLNKAQPTISRVINLRIPRHINRILELKEILPELLELFEKHNTLQKHRLMITYCSYTANILKASRLTEFSYGIIRLYANRFFELIDKESSVYKYFNNWIFKKGE